MSSIRSISILNTPPQNRRAVKTYVLEWDFVVIREAIEREIARSGQVFFVHDKVSSLATIAAYLQEHLPNVRIQTAHGQMLGKDLEKVMNEFVDHKFDVLVSTSIIESGMDLSRVNTLMVNNANHFGLTQLYQLRGRVGRSHVHAYAYFFLPSDRSISEEAMKRLDALMTHTELGAGFKIAMSDLEIRGPGNLLGAEQSGNIMAIGFDLYTRLLDESIQNFERQQKNEEERQKIFMGTLLELKYDGFIPHEYIAEDRQKIDVYKKIAAIETHDRIIVVKKEIEDRYGPIIPVLDRLFAIADIRVLANQMKVFSIREKEKHFEITLFEESEVRRQLLLDMVVKKTLVVQPHDPHCFYLDVFDQSQNHKYPFEIKIKKLKDLLLSLKT